MNNNSSSIDLDHLGQVQEKYHSMTKKQKALARFFVDNADIIANLSISQVAAKAGTLPSNITRFCNALGYKGFTEYKYRLRTQSLSIPAFSEKIRFEDSLAAIKQKLIHMNTEAIASTLVNIDEEIMLLSARALLNATKVVLLGQGGPDSSIQFARYHLMQVGIMSHAVSDTTTMSIAASLLKKGDVAIIISFRGETAAVLDAADIAKRNGAKIITITGSPSSSAAQLADYCFCYSSNIPDDLFYFHICRACEIITIGMLQIYIVKSSNDVSNIPKIAKAVAKNRIKKNLATEEGKEL